MPRNGENSFSLRFSLSPHHRVSIFHRVTLSPFHPISFFKPGTSSGVNLCGIQNIEALSTLCLEFLFLSILVCSRHRWVCFLLGGFVRPRLRIWIGHHEITDGLDEVFIPTDELTKGPSGGTEIVEFTCCQPLLFVGPSKLNEFS